LKLANLRRNWWPTISKVCGVAKDEVEGYKWFLLAAVQGDENAKKGAAAAESRLTRDQIKEGLKRARNFKPHAVPSVGDERAP
jgi:TPR repeat protein